MTALRYISGVRNFPPAKPITGMVNVTATMTLTIELAILSAKLGLPQPGAPCPC